MNLNARHLCAAEQSADVNVVNVIARDLLNTAPRLPQCPPARNVDGVVADDVVADGFLVPAICRARSMVLT